MSERQRQRIGSVGRRGSGQVQQSLHHFCDCQFLCGTVTDDGLFHFARCYFIYFEARFRRHDHRGAARFAHDQGGLQILREEKSLHHAYGGTMLFENVAQRPGDFYEATGMFPCGRTDNGAMRQRLRMWFGQPNHAVTGAAQRWIDAQNDCVGVRCGTVTTIQDRADDTFWSAKAVLQLFKLLRCDAHTIRLPEPDGLQKYKTIIFRAEVLFVARLPFAVPFVGIWR